MGSKKSIGILSVALAGATFGFTNSAYGLASYDASASLFLGISDIKDVTGASIDKPAELTIDGVAIVTTEGGGTVGMAMFDTDSEVDPSVPTALDVGDSLMQAAATDGTAGEAPPSSAVFGMVATDGTVFMENLTSDVLTIDFVAEYGYSIDLDAPDPPSEDADGSILIAGEGIFDTYFLIEDEANTIADGSPVMIGDGDGFDFSISLAPGESETLKVYVDAAGSARDREDRPDDIIPEPVTAVLGGLGMAALAAGTGRRR